MRESVSGSVGILSVSGSVSDSMRLRVRVDPYSYSVHTLLISAHTFLTLSLTPLLRLFCCKIQ